LSTIQKLNLWGQNLRDVTVLSNLPNLEVLVLTVNSINSLQAFQNLPNLKELYLRKNQIPADLDELRYLSKLRNLKVLNLAENPMSEPKGGLPCYRQLVLKFIPWL
jgi:internalin A